MGKPAPPRQPPSGKPSPAPPKHKPTLNISKNPSAIPQPKAKETAAPVINFDSDSDYDEDDDDYDLVEGDDGATYDYLSMDTATGLDHIAEQEAKPVANAKPNLTVNTEIDYEDSDEDEDDYEVVGEDDNEVYDFLAYNTAAGMQQIEDSKEKQKNTPQQQSKGALPASTVSNIQKKAQNLADGPTIKTPARPAPGPPTPVATPSTPSTPGQNEVKDTNKIKRKKASLPTNMPSQVQSKLHGTWLTNRYIVNNYILLEPLGQGSYAEVRLCKEKTQDQLYAIKIMNKDMLMKKSVGMSSTFMDDVRREIAIMKKLRHENVLQLFEVMDDSKINKLYLVLEYCKNGDLMQMTKGDARTNSCTPLSDLQVWDVLRQILKGLRYLHDNSIVHGDIKPQNLLVNEMGVIKIADFGISKFVNDTSDGEKEKLLETAGTPAFMSPELCSGKAYEGELADVYALGATIFMLRCGKPPFVANKLITLYHMIQEDPVVFPFPIAPGLKALILRMCEKVPEKRITLDGVIRDPWIATKPSGGAAEKKPVESLLQKNEKVVVSAGDMMQSVHLVGAVAQEPSKASKVDKTMEKGDMERRMKSFQKKASIRQRSFEKLDLLSEGERKPSVDADGDDDSEYGDIDDESTGERAKRLNSVEFNSVMDTLAIKKTPPRKKKVAPIPNLSMSRVLDGLPNSAIEIRASFHSEKGKRPNQEDRVTVIMDLSSLGDVIARPYLYQKYAYVAIFDGHGGESCSTMLQHKLHLKLAEESVFFDNLGDAFKLACKSADGEVCEELREKEDDSGSCGCFIVYDGRSKNLVVGNVGDSKCVLSRNGTALELTKDHRLDNEGERARVLSKGCVVRDGRVNGVLAVTRSFGDVRNKGFGGGGGIDAEPDVRIEQVTDRDEFVVLGSDGLWDVWGCQEAVNFLRLGLSRHHKVKQAVKELVKESLKRGSVDNVSCCVVCLNQGKEAKKDLK